jgi:hypothetical protein
MVKDVDGRRPPLITGRCLNVGKITASMRAASIRGCESVPIALFVLEALDCCGILLHGLSCRRVIQLRLNQRVRKPRLCNFRYGRQRHAGVLGNPLVEI